MALRTNLVQMADSGGNKERKRNNAAAAIELAQERGKALTEKLKTQPADPTVDPPVDPPAKNTGSGGTAAPAPAPVAPAEPLPESSYQESTDQTRALYDQAAKALSDKMAARPSWDGSSYDAEIDDLYAQITGRGQFRYSLNDDALWQQLKDSYMAGGKAAMRDTMGQAAALTGGYGSSYAQSVGQQAYDREMERLLDVAPELESRAYQRWTDEGAELKDRLGLARSLADDEWDKYLAEDDRWRDERNFAASERDTAYDNWLTERAYGDSRTEANRERIIQLIAIGYPPSDRELADAGMSRAEYAAIAAQYAPKASSGRRSSNPASEEDSAGAGSEPKGLGRDAMRMLATSIGTSRTPEKAFEAIPASTLAQMTEAEKEELREALRHAGVR